MIFVVGNSRSGTTMLGRILALNSDIHTFGELHFFEELVGIEEFAANHPWPMAKAVNVLEQLFTRAVDGYFAPFVPGRYELYAQKIASQALSLKPSDVYAAFLSQEAERAGRRIPCEQTPRYLFSAGEILKAYPNARFINLIRDPRDVLISQRSKWKRRFFGGSSIPIREAIRSWCNYHPWLVSRVWVSCLNYAATIKDDRFISIRFEDLVVKPNDEIKRLCDFLDVSFESEMLKAPQMGSSLSRDTKNGRGINKDRAGGWRKHGMQLNERLICEWVGGVRMKEIGYTDLLNYGQFSPRVLPSMMTLPIKLALAFPFNIMRFPYIVSSFRRRFSMQRRKP